MEIVHFVFHAAFVLVRSTSTCNDAVNHSTVLAEPTLSPNHPPKCDLLGAYEAESASSCISDETGDSLLLGIGSLTAHTSSNTA